MSRERESVCESRIDNGAIFSLVPSEDQFWLNEKKKKNHCFEEAAYADG